MMERLGHRLDRSVLSLAFAALVMGPACSEERPTPEVSRQGQAIAAAATWTFVDTGADDVTSTSFYDWLNGLTGVTSTDYMLFEINTGTSSGGAWCSQRADWYRSNYLTYAPGGQAVSSGAWQKWSRAIGGAWSAPNTSGFANLYGANQCGSYAYNWCSEWGFGGLYLGLMPGNSGISDSYAGAWSNGAGWTITVRIGPSFDAACNGTSPTAICNNGVVESGEQCDGGACCNTNCTFMTSGTTCRASAGACDVAEACNGASASCPADTLATAGTICRASTAACDPAETCSGSAASCPADANSCGGGGGGALYQPLATGFLSTNIAWSYNMGYQLTPNKTIVVDSLGGFFSGTKVVRLYRRSDGVLLASASVTAANTWAYAAISPVTLAANTAYSVAVDLAGSGGAYYSGAGLPKSNSDATINFTCYIYGSSADPCTSGQYTGDMYGMADLKYTTSATSCGNGTVDAGEQCDGGACCSASCQFNTSGTICRTSAGVCDVAETCNGGSATCPGDLLTAAGTVCRAAAGACDVAETCSGGNASCPADTLATAGTICRASTAACDPAESCSGAAASCPADASSCGGSGGALYQPLAPASGLGTNIAWNYNMGYEFTPNKTIQVTNLGGLFNGTKTVRLYRRSDGVVLGSATVSSANSWAYAAISPVTLAANTVYSVAVELAGSGGAYYSPESFVKSNADATINKSCYVQASIADPCTSYSATNAMYGLADLKYSAAAGTCGNGTVDPGEQCDGGACCSASCQFKTSGTVCRAAAGVCDVAESCNGGSASCPGDSFTTAGTICRASAGVCDVAETCNGGSASCPGDGFSAAGTICRASTAACDPAETCSGAAASCPADASSCGGSGGALYQPLAPASGLVTGFAWNYNMGYEFTPNKTIQVTNLGGLFNGAKTVRLYRRSDGVVLASASVSSANSWAYAAISPVTLAANTPYTVAVELAGSGGAYYSSAGLPKSNADATINKSCYVIASIADPCTSTPTTAYMYGVADLKYSAGAGTCGNGTVESGEQCDGGACCNTNCTFNSGTICRASTAACDPAETCSGAGASCPADTTSCSGGSYTITHEYDASGRLVKVTYPPDGDNETVSYTYGGSGLAMGRLVKVSRYNAAGTWQEDLVKDVKYVASGELASITYGNDVTTSYTYDPYSARLSRIQVGPDAAPVTSIDYTYDWGGRITTMRSGGSNPLASANVDLGYDEAGRVLTTTHTSDPSLSFAYTYDEIGRVTSRKLGTAAAEGYVYPADGGTRVHAVCGVGAGASCAAPSYGYNANGEMTIRQGVTIEYDRGHQPARVGQTTFLYDALGSRVKKVGTSTTYYVGGIYEVKDGQPVKYYYAGGLRVAKRAANSNTYFHVDHQGSTRLLTSQTGQVQGKNEYEPFGKTISNLSDGANLDSHRYTGQESDDETGLIFYRARYYDPGLGRFIAPDALDPDPNDAQLLDPYAYCRNSPINSVDPSGNSGKMGWAMLGIATMGMSHWISAAAMFLATNNMLAFVSPVLAMIQSDNPVLQSIGQVILGVALTAATGNPLWGLTMNQTLMLSAAVSAAASPISPLDPGVKKALGWAYTVYGAVSNLHSLATSGTGGAMGLKGVSAISKALGGPDFATWAQGSYLRAGVALAGGELAEMGGAVLLGDALSRWGGKQGRWLLGLVKQVLGAAQPVAGAAGAGPLSIASVGYDMAYTLRYPSGRVIDLSGGDPGEVWTFYTHNGFESNSVFGRQHIRVSDGHGSWEAGNNGAVYGASLGMNAWFSTQKVTVILSTEQAGAFREILNGALKMGAGAYTGFARDSYTFISRALHMATGKTAADIHINPGFGGRD